MGVAAFVVQIVISVGDTDVFAVVLAQVALVNDCRHRGMVEPRVENNRFRAFADPVAKLAVVGLAFLVIFGRPLLVSRYPILDRVQLLEKLLLHNVSSLDAFPTL